MSAICSCRLVCRSWAQQVAAFIHFLEPGSGPVPAQWAAQFPNVEAIDISRARRRVLGELNPVQRILVTALYGKRSPKQRHQAKHSIRRKAAELLSIPRLTSSTEQLKKLSNLQQVKANRVHLRQSGIRSLASLTQLTHIDLSGSNIPDSGMEELCNLKQLISLDLQGCESVHASTMQATLKSFTSLTHLNLKGCSRSVNNLLIPALTCTGLTSLSLNNCPNLTWPGLQYLRKLIPPPFPFPPLP